MTTLAGQYDPTVAQILGDEQIAPPATVSTLMAACTLPQRAMTQQYAGAGGLHETNTTTITERYLHAVLAPAGETVSITLHSLFESGADLAAQSTTFDGTTKSGAKASVLSSYPPAEPQFPGSLTAYEHSITAGRSVTVERYEVAQCNGAMTFALPVSDIETL